MTTKPSTKSKGIVTELDRHMSEDEMDRCFAARQDEIELKLAEARAAFDRGEFSPLEPLHEFLQQAHEAIAAERVIR